MGTDFQETNIINPPPQRTVRHTSRDKECACLLKGKKKKRNVHFCSSFALRNLIESHGNVWARLCSASAGAGQRRAAPLPITLRSVATCSALQPRAPPALRPPREPVSRGAASRPGQWDAGWGPGAGRRQQTQAGGPGHCCTDFFSLWKLKLVRLFSFLCFCAK